VGRGVIKENAIVRTFVNVTMYPQYNNKTYSVVYSKRMKWAGMLFSERVLP
jgi:hypothetical protein